MLFAPAIDADGDPASNPVLSAPAPVIDLAGAMGGLIRLAAQLEPSDRSAIPAGVPVTFLVWHAGSPAPIVSRLVPSDEWGAVSLELPMRAPAGEYAYQASAPGYGATEVRRFRFDPAQVRYTLHRARIPLSQSQIAPGRFVFTVRSPEPLVDGRDLPELMIGRQPEAAQADVDSPLSGILGEVRAAGLGLPFPRVAMRIAGAFTATAEVELPPGDYAVVAALAVNGSRAGLYYSQPARVAVQAKAAQPAAAAEWVSPVEYEPGRVLVRHRAPAGQAAFSLVDADRAPRVEEDLSPPAGPQHFEQTVRTGPFQWRTLQHDLEVVTVGGDGKKAAWVESIDHTPLVRRYTLAIRSYDPRAYTDTLRIDVTGPGGVALLHLDQQVALQPGRLTRYTFDVSTELGEPMGLRIALDDPWYQDLIDMFRETFASTQLKVTGSLRFFAQVIGIVLFECAWKIPDDKGECEFLPNGGSTIGLAWDIAAYLAQEGFQLDEDNPLKSRFKLGTAGIGGDAGISVSFQAASLCYDPVSLKALSDFLATTAREANALFNSINEKIKADKPSRLPDAPLFWIISLWGEFSFGLSFGADAEGTSFELSVGVFVSLTGVVGIGLPLQQFQLDDIAKIYKILTLTSSAVSGTLAIIQNVRAALKGDPRCRPNWPDSRPADDRQDVWQDVDAIYSGDTLDETISTLTDVVQRARAAGLTLAERWLAYQLRSAELSRHALDAAASQAYGEAVVETIAGMTADVRGFISGTLAVSASQTISDAVAARIERAIASVEALPYRRDRAALLAEHAAAVRQYEELFGQEMALRRELSLLFTRDAVGVLASGFAPATLSALKLAGLPAQLISPFPGAGTLGGLPAPYVPPADAPRALVVPTGGLRLVANSPEARAWLDEYVRTGGLLIVFTQMLGDDWAVLPGGAVRAVGYDEDQRCEQESVRPAAVSHWLAWVGMATPDIQVDGAFLAWPADATILLARTSGTYAGYPAMIEYPYGQGRVLATTAYGDWAIQSSITWGDDWHLARSVLIRAYLLSRGQDADDAIAVTPGLTETLAVPVTNTAGLTVTQASIELHYQPYWRGLAGLAQATLPVTLAPGASTVAAVALPIPTVMRGTHNWTRVGLFRLRVNLVDTAGEAHTTWGPFVWSKSPVSLAAPALSLSAAAVAGRPGQVVPITATVRNFSPTAQTVRLRGIVDLPATTITLAVPANGVVTHPYSVTLDRSRRPSAGLYNTSNNLLSQSSLGVYIAEPSLRLDPSIPPALASGVQVRVRVSNRASPNQPSAASLGGTLAVTLVSPAGNALWSDARPVPPLQLGASSAATFTLGALNLNEWGEYAFVYALVDGASLATQGRWPVPSRLAIDGAFDRASYRAREAGVFTASLRNAGFVSLSSPVTITIPALALSSARQVALPALATKTVSVAFTLPAVMTAGPAPVIVTVGAAAGAALSSTHGLVIASSLIRIGDPSPGSRPAGEALTVTLENAGGVDTAVTHTLRLVDVANVPLASASGGVSLAVGARSVVSLALPAGLASGAYWLRVDGRDQVAQRPFSAGFLLTVAGVGASLAVGPDRPSYAVSQTVAASGRVTATRGAVSGLLRLSVSAAGNAGLAVKSKARVNTIPVTETGFIDHRAPAMAMDAAGNAYAVWQDYRNAHTGGTGIDIFFARRPAGGGWSANEQVNAEDPASAVTQSAPDIAVDPAGNAYVVWVEPRPGLGSDVVFAYRPSGGSWSAPVRVNDDGGTANQTAPAIAVDAAGNAYAVWQDARNTSLGDIYFAFRPAGGSWSANVKVNDGPNAARALPDIAASPDGNAWAAWRDQRNPAAAIYASYRPAEGAWGANERVNSGATIGSSGPSVAVDANSAAYAVWDSGSIYYATRPLTGTWTAQARVNDITSGAKASPAIALAAPNAAHVVWDDPHGGTYTSIYYASLSITGTWSASVRVNDDPITNSRYHNAAVIAVSPAGLVVAWEDNRTAPGINEIYGAARAAGGAWSANGLVNDDYGGGTQMRPDIAVDGSGNADAVWVDGRSCVLCPALGNAVFASRWSPGAGWSADQEVHRSPQHPDQTALAVDAGGSAHAVWQDTLAGSGVLRVLRASRPSGGAWEPGAVLSSTTRDQRNPDVAVDGAGAAVAIWDQTTFGLHAADRPAGGAWGPGRIITTQHGYDAGIAADAAGAAYAVWARVSPNDIWSAYRPPAGEWTVPVKVNDDAGNAGQNSPAIAVDGSGAVYAAWLDFRNSASLGDVYFADRPAGGAWSPNVRVTAPMTCTNAHPAIAASQAGVVYLAWSNCRGVYLAARDLAGAWSAPVQVSDLGEEPAIALSPSGDAHVVWSQRTPGAMGPDTPDIYHAVVGAPAGQAALWSADIPVSVSAPASQAISQAVGLLGGQPGKYWLTAQLISAFSQTLALSRTAFYIMPGGTALTLQTDRPAYHPGQSIQVSGRVTNTAATAANLDLRVQAGAQMLISQTLALGAGQGAPYAAVFTAPASVVITASAGLAVAVEPVAVGDPRVTASLHVPPVVGSAPFSATLSVTNTGDLDAALAVTIANAAPAALALRPGEAAIVVRAAAVTSTTRITATIGGDVHYETSQLAQFGEGAALSLLPPDSAYAGAVAIRYVVAGSGALPASAALLYRLDGGAAVTESTGGSALAVEPGGALSGTLVVSASAGLHTLDAELRGPAGQLFSQARLTLTLTPAGATLAPSLRILGVRAGGAAARGPEPASAGADPYPLMPEAGQAMSLLVDLANDGPSGPVILDLQVFDPPQQWIITPAAYLTQTYALSLAVPADMPAGTVVGQVGAGDQTRPFTLTVAGADVGLALQLDQPSYLAGSRAVLTATLTERAGRSGAYHLSLRAADHESFVTVTVGAGQIVRHAFTFTATASGRASVILAATPPAGEESQRTLMIDSLPVMVADGAAGAALAFSRPPVYQAGETAFFTAAISGPLASASVFGPLELTSSGAGPLQWSAPLTSGGVLAGAYPLSFTFPSQARAGRYTFALRADGDTQLYEVDVRGWNVLARRVFVDARAYAQRDAITATVEWFNETGVPLAGARLSAFILLPDARGGIDLAPVVSREVSLQPGLNVLTVSGAFTTPASGPHQLIIELHQPGSQSRLAGASAQFDVGQAHLVALTTDGGAYGLGVPAIGRLDVAGHGPAQLTVTDAHGAVLFNRSVTLDGFAAYSFTIPTASYGDNALVGRSVDAAGGADQLVRAYAVPQPRDALPPTLTVASPASVTVLTSAEPVVTITVSGRAEDNRGAATVLVNGQTVTPAAGGLFTAALAVRQGTNLVSVAALDAAGNVAFAPMAEVRLAPLHALRLSANRIRTWVGDRITFRAELTGSAPISEAAASLGLPTGIVTGVVASASTGQANLSSAASDTVAVHWTEATPGPAPSVLSVAAGIWQSGTLTATLRVVWPWGAVETAVLAVEALPELGHRVYLPLAGGRQSGGSYVPIVTR